MELSPHALEHPGAVLIVSSAVVADTGQSVSDTSPRLPVGRSPSTMGTGRGPERHGPFTSARWVSGSPPALPGGLVGRDVVEAVLLHGPFSVLVVMAVPVDCSTHGLLEMPSRLPAQCRYRLVDGDAQRLGLDVGPRCR